VHVDPERHAERPDVLHGIAHQLGHGGRLGGGGLEHQLVVDLEEQVLVAARSANWRTAGSRAASSGRYRRRPRIVVTQPRARASPMVASMKRRTPA
jgi:hypothetical protein